MALRIAARHAAPRWAVLVVLSAACAAALVTLHVSAALLLGPLIAAIVLATREVEVRVPPLAFVAAQAVVGAMIARAFTPALLVEIGRRWPLLMSAVVTVLAVATALGWLLCRWRVLPGTTAAWGTFPGAATVMVLMAGEFGADMQLVAFMQYARALLATVVASLVARAFVAGTSVAAATPHLSPAALAATLAVAAASAAAARAAAVPAGALLGPMAACAVLQDVGWLRIELPYPLLALAYAVVGWSIGTRFSRESLAYVARALPRILLAILALIASCACLAGALAVLAGVDPLTAYLAMSPGGADTVAIIAAASPKVDMPFVMALQMARFLTVLAVGPWLARRIARSALPDPA